MRTSELQRFVLAMLSSRLPKLLNPSCSSHGVAFLLGKFMHTTRKIRKPLYAKPQANEREEKKAQQEGVKLAPDGHFDGSKKATTEYRR